MNDFKMNTTTSSSQISTTTSVQSANSSSMLSELLKKPSMSYSSECSMLANKSGQLHPTSVRGGSGGSATGNSSGCGSNISNNASTELSLGIEEMSTSPGTIVRSPDELVCSNSNHIEDFILESQSIGLVFENTAKLLPQREINLKNYESLPMAMNTSTTCLDDMKTVQRSQKNSYDQTVETSWMTYFENGPSNDGFSPEFKMLNNPANPTADLAQIQERPIHRTASLPLTHTTDNVCLKMAADSTDYSLHAEASIYPNFPSGCSNGANMQDSKQTLKNALMTNGTNKKLTQIKTHSNIHKQLPCQPCQNPWCSIFYYELNVRIGDAFHSDSSQIIIDGFTEPCYKSDRFSLGSLSNVNRSLQILSTRPHIGRGVKLIKTPTEVYIHCLSRSAVFVQSLSCNRYHNWHLATVVKVPSGCKLKVFDKKEFMMLLNQFELENFEAVYSLTHFCLIRLSFVKGWGDDYKRQTVTSTPCWIEIHLNEPLKWLDPILARLGSPKKPCTSTS